LAKEFPRVVFLIQMAESHHYARNRGETDCSKDTKSGELARARIAKATGN
jgi:hypothetical protein